MQPDPHAGFVLALVPALLVGLTMTIARRGHCCAWRQCTPWCSSSTATSPARDIVGGVRGLHPVVGHARALALGGAGAGLAGLLLAIPISGPGEADHGLSDGPVQAVRHVRDWRLQKSVRTER